MKTMEERIEEALDLIFPPQKLRCATKKIDMKPANKTIETQFLSQRIEPDNGAVQKRSITDQAMLPVG